MIGRLTRWLGAQSPPRRRLYSLLVALSLLTVPCYATGLCMLTFSLMRQPQKAAGAPTTTVEPTSAEAVATAGDEGDRGEDTPSDTARDTPTVEAVPTETVEATLVVRATITPPWTPTRLPISSPTTIMRTPTEPAPTAAATTPVPVATTPPAAATDTPPAAPTAGESPPAASPTAPPPTGEPATAAPTEVFASATPG